jgi:hypothetical protein
MKQKIIVLVMSLLITGLAFGQVDSRIDDTVGHMRDIIQTPNRTVDEVHNGIIDWINRNYTKPTEVIMVDNPDYIRLREHVNLPGVGTETVDCYAQTEWEIKDGRVRLTMNQYDCKSQYANFNALVGMRNKKGKVKFGYSAHHNWVLQSFDGKVSGIKAIGKEVPKEDDW